MRMDHGQTRLTAILMTVWKATIVSRVTATVLPRLLQRPACPKPELSRFAGTDVYLLSCLGGLELPAIV